MNFKEIWDNREPYRNFTDAKEVIRQIVEEYNMNFENNFLNLYNIVTNINEYGEIINSELAISSTDGIAGIHLLLFKRNGATRYIPLYDKRIIYTTDIEKINQKAEDMILDYCTTHMDDSFIAVLMIYVSGQEAKYVNLDFQEEKYYMTRVVVTKHVEVSQEVTFYTRKPLTDVEAEEYASDLSFDANIGDVEIEEEVTEWEYCGSDESVEVSKSEINNNVLTYEFEFLDD